MQWSRLQVVSVVPVLSTDTLEVLTNATQIDLHLKMRQVQEVVRISAKYDDEPIREEFNDWIGGGNAVGRKPTIFHLGSFTIKFPQV